MRSKVNPSLYTSPPPPRRKEKMSSLKKFKPPRSGKMINICSVENVIVFPQKYCWGGGGHVCASKERAHPHGENGPHVERENRPDRKKCTHKEKSHPHGFFYSPPPPGRAPTLAPSLKSADNDRPPTHFIPFF